MHLSAISRRVAMRPPLATTAHLAAPSIIAMRPPLATTAHLAAPLLIAMRPRVATTRDRMAPRNRAAGFSLVEVMVALVVCSVGLLGLAKMESLALSSTSAASSRSLAAMEASSLAAAMHADPGYWAGGFAPALPIAVQVQGGAVTLSDAGLQALAGTANCTVAGVASCTAAAMAAYDLKQWGSTLQAVLPGYLATITCSTVGFPVTCTIQIQWAENTVAMDANQTTAGALQGGVQAPTYVLYVQP